MIIFCPCPMCDHIGRPRHPYMQDVLFFHLPDFNSRNLIETATTVIKAISNPFDVMQGNSFGGHMPARKSHKLPYLPHTRCDYIGRPRHPYLQVLHQPDIIPGTLLRLPLLWLKLFPTPLMWCRGTPLEDMCQHANVTSFPMPLRTKQDSRRQRLSRASY